MAITDKSYSTSINDIASGAYANINDSITHSKGNIITFDKMCNWYLFEDTVLMPMPFLNKYKETLLNNSIYVTIDPKFYYKPEYVSYNIYNTTDLWYLILFLNEMKSVEEFNKPRILVFDPSRLATLKNIINTEGNRYTRDNPKAIYKHYIKNPNLPSDKLLPDDEDEIMSPGIGDVKEIPITSLGYNMSLSDYYFYGKSKMELFRNVEGSLVDTREYHYMDGIRISNTNSNTVYDNEYAGYERKFTGWINLSKMNGLNPKKLIDKNGNYTGYKFAVNGINGSAYISIDGVPMMTEDGQSKLIFNDTDKQYDYFERESRNSDFKQRNTIGWKKQNGVGRVATDRILKKPVFILDSLASLEGDVIWSELDSKALDTKTEPYGEADSGELLFKYKFKTKKVENVKIMPFSEITYNDGTVIREYSFSNDWMKFINKEDYIEVYLLSSIITYKEFSKVKFGIELVPTKGKMLSIGEFRLDSINVYRLNNNIVYNKDLLINKDWVRYTVVYRSNGDTPSMFNLMWKEPGSNAYTIIPQSSLAIVPDDRDNYNDPSSMKECILVKAESKGDNDSTYLDILTSKFERRIAIGENHSKLIYHTNINIDPYEKLYIKNITHPDSNFKIFINKKEVEYLDGESAYGFAPSIHIDEYTHYLKLDLVSSLKILLEIVDTTPYQPGELVQYSIESNISGEIDIIDDEGFYIDPLTLNHIEEDDGEYKLAMSKNNLIEINMYSDEGIISNKQQFVLEFNMKIDSSDRGLFIVNLDKKEDNDNKKYMVVFLYTGEYFDKDSYTPEYYMRTYVYKVNDEYDLLNISNIDNGIDWYKYPYDSLNLYKNSLPLEHKFYVDNLKLYRGEENRFYIRKNKKNIIVGLEDKELGRDIIIGSWIDDNWEDYMGGINSFQFLNINDVKLSDIKLSM